MKTKFDFDLEFTGQLEENLQTDHKILGQKHPVRVLLKAKELLEKSGDTSDYFEATYFPETLSFKADFNRCLGLSTKQIKLFEEYANRVKNHPVT